MNNPPSTTSHLSHGYTIALLSSAALSTTAIFIRYLTQTYQMPSLVLAFWRDVFVTLVLLLALGLLRPNLLRVNRKHLQYLLLYGLLLAIFNASWTQSVALNGAAISTVLVYSSVAFTALLGWIFLKERLNWGKAAAISLSLSGCVLVSGVLNASASSLTGLGIFTGVLSGLLYAIYSLMGRSASQRGLNPWTTLLYTFGFAAVFLLIFNLIPVGLPGAAIQPVDLMWLGDEWAGWGILLLLAAGPTLAGFGLYNVSLVYLPSSIANLIMTTEPVFTAVIAYILLDERLNAQQIFGSLLILAGVFLLRIYEGRVERKGFRV
jgi:drug/metabolite transporter (DMT)-like permease